MIVYLLGWEFRLYWHSSSRPDSQLLWCHFQTPDSTGPANSSHNLTTEFFLWEKSFSYNSEFIFGEYSLFEYDNF